MLLDKFLLASFFYLSLSSSVSAGNDSDESKEDSGEDLSDDCKLPPVLPGPFACLGHFPKWTYDSASGVCKPFVYGGCRGTKNLFSTEDECQAKCMKKRSPKKLPDPAVPSPCSLPVAQGNCRAHIPSFYFDSASGKCKTFVFTGCKGNANNFMSPEDCEKTCVRPAEAPSAKTGTKGTKSPTDTKTPGEICDLPPEAPASGIRCMAFIPMWTFNSTSGQCERYIYGGCGRTANLFNTEEACNAVCGLATRENRNSCLLPVDKGPCMGFATRYAFVKEKNRCEPFTYGLCQGNKNNFKTAEECFQQCGGELPASADSGCQDVICSTSNKRYIERGCRPEFKGKACCPTSFTCPDEKASGTCHYRGLTFKVGDAVPQVTEDYPCKTQCACVASSQHTEGATIKCTDAVCPVPKLPENKANCVLKTKPGKCCAKFDCDDDSSEEKNQQDKQPKLCFFNGNKYEKGQEIPTGDPCKTCTCTDKFNGPNGPGCHEVHCLIDNRIGCVPVYQDNVCCPTSYRCVDDSVGNKSRIIRVESGQQAAVTLPFFLGNEKKSKEVKAEQCLLRKEAGPCRMYLQAFHYDAEEQKCSPFFYGGCKGNANRFETEEACMAACHVAEKQDQQQQEQQSRAIDLTASESAPAVFGAGSRQEAPLPQRCTFPMSTGPCRMSIPSFYYDTEAKDCRFFYYGGCKGNPNRFETVEECRTTCLVSDSIDDLAQEVQQVAQNQITLDLETTTTTTEAAPVNICELPAEEGPCRGHVKSFAFNSASGQCEEFWYGGCRGNANRFETQEECVQRCNPAAVSTPIQARSTVEDPRARCKLPADVGFCRAFTNRFYYDSLENVCKLFSYGGCMGNGNNFATAKECLEACRVPTQQTDGGLEDDVLPGGRARARARARARDQFEEEPIEAVAQVAQVEPVCSLLNVTFKLGDEIETEDPCEECVCSTPPEITCIHRTCPDDPLINDPSAVCSVRSVPGQCCRQIECVSANPPVVIPQVVDACQDAQCSEALNEPDQNELIPEECQGQKIECPTPPNDPAMICKASYVPGRCCPDYSCVSANPPSIDVCEGVVCGSNEHCEVVEQESFDGSWKPPIGVCAANV